MFRFPDLPDGRWGLRALPSLGDEPGVSRRLIVPPLKIIDIPPGGRRLDERIVVSHGRVMEGTVVDSSGRPIEGALVEIGGTEPTGGRIRVRCQTDALGHYILSGIPESLSRTYGRATHTDHAAEVASIPDGAVRCDFVLASLGHILVSVVEDATGTPPARFRLAISFGAGNSPRTLASEHAGEECPIRIDGVGTEYFRVEAVELDFRGNPTGRSASGTRAYDEVPRGAEVVLRIGAAASVSGFLTTASRNRPLPGVSVTLRSRTPPREAVEVTGDYGEYDFKGVAIGSYTLTADPGAGWAVIPTPVEVRQTTEPTVASIRAHVASPVRARVVARAGANVAGAKIAAGVLGLPTYGSDARIWETTAPVSPDGTWICENVPHGDLTITLMPPNSGGAVTRRLNHPRDTADEVLFEIGANGRISARLTVQGNTPEGVSSLILEPVDKSGDQMDVAGVGGLLEGIVPAGSYRARFVWNGIGVNLPGQTTIADSRTTHIAADIPAGRVTFALTALPSGEGIGSLMFLAGDSGQPGVPMGRRIASMAELTFRQFPAGSWRAELYPWRGSSGGPLATANFTVTPGCDIEVPLVPLER